MIPKLNDSIVNIGVRCIGGLNPVNTQGETFTFTMLDYKIYLIVIIRDENPGALAIIAKGFGNVQFLTQNDTAVQITYSGDQCTITRAAKQWVYAVVLAIG